MKNHWLKQKPIRMTLSSHAGFPSDDAQAIQQMAASSSDLANVCAFATHQDVYKQGVVKARWENTDQRQAAIFAQNLNDVTGFGRTQAATA